MARRKKYKHMDENEHMDEQPVEEQTQTKSEVEPQVAPTPGTAILATATIDSLFTLVYGTRSADLAATPTYSWGTGNQIIAQWPTLLTPQNTINNSAMFATFIARAMAPSTIAQ